MKYFTKILMGSILSIIIVSESFASWNPSPVEKRLIEHCPKSDDNNYVKCITFVYILNKQVLSPKELDGYANAVEQEYALSKEIKEKGEVASQGEIDNVLTPTNKWENGLSKEKRSKFGEAHVYAGFEFSAYNFTELHKELSKATSKQAVEKYESKKVNAEAGIKCVSNSDCAKDEYCTGEHKCADNGGNIQIRKNVPEIGNVWLSSQRMDWESAKNYCLSHNKELLDISGNKLQCYESGTSIPFKDKQTGYCCAKNQDCKTNGENGKPVQILLDDKAGTAKRTDGFYRYYSNSGNHMGKQIYTLPALEIWFNKPEGENSVLYLTYNGEIKQHNEDERYIAYAACVDSNGNIIEKGYKKIMNLMPKKN